MSSFARSVTLLLIVLLLAACAPEQQAGTPSASPNSGARRLATVELPPTLDDSQRRAAQIAALPTATFRAPILAITPTIYVGTFIGIEADEPSLPVIDPALFLGTLGAPVSDTFDLTTCALPVDPVFGTQWAEGHGLAEQLGCASGTMSQANGSAQAFERGRMIFTPNGEIWALQPDTAYWHTAQAPEDRLWDQPAPDGLHVPALGFGAFWKATAAIREGLGYALGEESGTVINTQHFEHGLLLRDGASGATFALIGEPNAGVVYGPFS